MPLFIIDAGTSAGLNLLWDRYRYRYVFEDGSAVERGNSDSRVFLECEIRGRGRPPLPEKFPAVARRIGIDLHPIDPTDSAEVCWLRSLLWPDRPERVERLQLAIETVRQDPPELVTGDVVDVMPCEVGVRRDVVEEEADVRVTSSHGCLPSLGARFRFEGVTASKRARMACNTPTS